MDANTSNRRPFSHIAAGHDGIEMDESGILIIKPCTQAEIDFYEAARAHPRFMVFMPVFMGSLRAGNTTATVTSAPDLGTASETTGSKSSATVEEGQTTVRPAEWKPSGGAKLQSDLAIVLENVTAGFKCPNVIDLKLGSRLWDNDAPEAKRQKLDGVSRTTTSGSLGFRISGMKVWTGQHPADAGSTPVSTTPDKEDGNVSFEAGYKVFNKNYGRDNIQASNVRDGFEQFFSSAQLTASNASDQGKARRKLVIERIWRDVKDIQDMLEQEELRMYSASILIVYEGDPEALDAAIAAEEQLIETADKKGSQEEPEEESDEDEESLKVNETVLIDFAHAHWTPGQGPDENILKGVRSIADTLDQMVEQEANIVDG